MDSYKEKSKSYYNKTAKNYSNTSDGEFVKPMYEEIINRIISKNPKKILDLGCGTGYVLSEVKKIYKLKNKDLDMYGLDISEEMIKIANENLKGEANLKVGDSEYIPWEDNSFDLVVCNASFHHYPNPKKTLLEIKRVLNSNGTLILGDPTAPIIVREIFNLFIKYSNSGDYRVYNQNEIEELFKSTGFIPKNFKLLKRNKFFINGEVSKD
ncbi:MAG: methyltransferase domain-containing protein [Methanobacteriaceae archaeon]|nr:methyltransferase domain-containing protein [Methanobacteriaceae archaeon]